MRLSSFAPEASVGSWCTPGWFVGATTILTTMFLTLPGFGEVRYTVTPLTEAQMYESAIAYGINESGEVVGRYRPARGGNYAWLWQDGVLTNLDTLMQGTGERLTLPTAINDAGWIVGYPRFLLKPNETSYDLTVLPDYAEDVNNAGQVVGNGFLWPGPVALPGRGKGINDSGRIVGYLGGVGFTSHGFVLEDGVVTDLGELPGDRQGYSVANDVNELNQIAGYARGADGYFHTVMWDAENLIHDLGPGYGYALNNNGQIVGEAVYPRSAPALWDHGTYYDLNDLIPSESGWTLTYVFDINDRGQIVGAGMKGAMPSGEQALLLTPIPEPSIASFASTLDAVLDIHFGTLTQGDPSPAEPFEIWNIADPASGADLDLVSIEGSGDLGELTTNLSPFTDLAPSSFSLYTASMDTSTVGDFSATYALNFSDELGTDQLLTLNLSGSVVPEPSTLVLLGMGALGLLAYAWRKRRR